MDLVQIAVMGLNEAKSLQKDLEAKGINLVLNHNDRTCTRGCSITVEVHAKEQDIPVIQEVYSKNYSKLLDGLDINVEQMNSVYDPSQGEATCPACGYNFSTSSSECPDCGLVLG